MSVPGVGSFATVSATGTTYTYVYHLTDHLGSTNIDLDASGAVLQYLNYEPFGQVRYNHQSGSWNNDEKYIGQEQDSETNWQYLNARYYDNVRGRFMSADQVFIQLGDNSLLALLTGDRSAQEKFLSDPQQLNSYSYARNNPYANRDSSGNYIETGLDLISIGLSLRDAYRHPTIANGAWLGLDTVSLVLPLPAAVGYIRHGDEMAQVSSYFAKVSQGGSTTRMYTLFARNASFRFSRRAWSAGESGNNVASLVGHYVKHGGEVGASNVRDYYNKANDLISSKNTQSFLDPFKNNGDVIHYNAKTYEKVVTDRSGNIRSYYVENRQSYRDTYTNVIQGK